MTLTLANKALIEVTNGTLADTDVVEGNHWLGTFQADCVLSILRRLTLQTARLASYKQTNPHN